MAAVTPWISLLTADVDRAVTDLLASTPWRTRSVSWRDDIGILHSDALVPKLAEGEPAAICICADVPQMLALEVASMIDQQYPSIGVVMVHQPTADLWRAAAHSGVGDIVAPEMVPVDLLPSLQAAIERGQRIRAAQVAAAVSAEPRGKVIVVLAPKGGSGKTMVSTNLAAALATSGSGDAVILDLDCVFGDVAGVMGMVPEHTVGELATVPVLDSTMVKMFLSRHESSGLYVLPGSGLPEEGEAVTSDLSGRIIDLLHQSFQYVVVDTAAGLDERALAAIERATDVILLASLDIASIRNLGKEINALDRLGLTQANRHFILNRADAQVGLELADVEAAIGQKVSAALSSSRMVPLSMNQGRVLVVDEPQAQVAQQLRAFASTFAPMAAAAVAPVDDRKSRFGRRR